MNLKSLLLCSDDKIVRVLRRTLGDLDIGIQHCTDAETALRHLTRDRFEAIIVDCADLGANNVLRGARSAPCNKRAIAVAILDPESGLRSAFDSGAHFTLYKPVTAERAKSSFRAARALMKRERRRNSRVSVTLTVEMSAAGSDIRYKVYSTDLGEGGLAINLPQRHKLHGRWNLFFTLPGANKRIEVPAEFAWEGSGTQVGLRFVDPSPEIAHQLRDWLSRNSPDAEKDDPPVRGQLTDLSLGGCYLEISSPFPVSTRVTLSMRAGGVQLRPEGIVRVMHAEKGMGVEFTQTTPEHRVLLEKFLASLAENPDTMPELMVEPEGLETETVQAAQSVRETGEDPLLDLFRNHAGLEADSFLAELRKQRGLPSAAAATAS
ncbi:MAG TPA: PilZ domain-containing protein [Candidatus Aquilonibacter sp.]|jgi:c-di-GMP-binding flagellar brake protein YcgR|nr:PilZ domain-containing protein [Candidatus Aquilonibacter sp.]